MKSNSKAFIVDDDVASAASLKALLYSEGLPTEVFHSAESFLAAYGGNSMGCLILDIRLSGMSGIDLQRRLVSIEAPLSIVFISGHADEGECRQAISQGATAVFDKPFPGTALCSLARKAIAD